MMPTATPKVAAFLVVSLIPQLPCLRRKGKKIVAVSWARDWWRKIDAHCNKEAARELAVYCEHTYACALHQ